MLKKYRKMAIKIWTQKELNKGYIPSDKITRRGVSFEIYGLNNFSEKYLNNDKIKLILSHCVSNNSEFLTKDRLKQLIDYVKFHLKESEKFKNMEKEGYLTHIYLNLNRDGVDCFLNR